MIERERSRYKKRREPPQTLPPCTVSLILGGDILRALKLGFS
jgi:hypothetical protein